MNDALLYVALIDKSIAYNKADGIDVMGDAPDNAYDVAARGILLEQLHSYPTTIEAFYKEVDAIREEQKK